jgi:hypothetical protein
MIQNKVPMRSLSFVITIVLALFLTCAATVSAVSVSVAPLQVSPGETITISVQDMPDGSNCTMSWEVYIDETGPDYKWNIVGLSFPINLEYADYRVINQNTATNKVTLVNDVPDFGTRELILSGDSVDGIWTGYHGNDFINGSWPTIQNEGTVLAGKTSILSLWQWHGTKLPNPLIESQVNGGPDDFTIPLSFTGIENGKVRFTIIVNGTNVATNTIIIGSPASSTGSLLVRSIPSNADIYLDGVYYGKSPAIIGNVPPGVRTVTLEKSGSTDYTSQVTVYPGRLTTVITNRGSGIIPGQSGSLYIRSSPSGATITIDGNYYGVTPRIISGFSEGNHAMTLSKTGYSDYSATVTVKAKGLTQVFAQLTQSTNAALLSGQEIDVYSYSQPGKAVGRINPADVAGSNGALVSTRLATVLAGQVP